jgi:hypothetical protein
MHTWLIPDGYVPSGGEKIQSHEAICVVNPNVQDAHLTVDVYFFDRDPWRDLPFTIGAERSARIILGEKYQLSGGDKIGVPEDTPFSLRIRSDLPVAIQYTRLDTRLSKLALMSIFVPEFEL